MTQGSIPGQGASDLRCSRCGRVVGVHLSFPDREAVQAGQPAPGLLCYRCHRLATWGRLPPLLDDVGASRQSRTVQFLMYRVGMMLLAGLTLVITAQTGRLAYFLTGLGGIILLFALSLSVDPRRMRRRKGSRAPAAEDDGAPPAGTDEEGPAPPDAR